MSELLETVGDGLIYFYQYFFGELKNFMVLKINSWRCSYLST
jgi:hypothetical protein